MIRECTVPKPTDVDLYFLVGKALSYDISWYFSMDSIVLEGLVTDITNGHDNRGLYFFLKLLFFLGREECCCWMLLLLYEYFEGVDFLSVGVLGRVLVGDVVDEC